MSNQQKTKKGAAAIMVVIIITMVTGVIALSFVRLMLLNASNTNDYSLSDSAYNSALAGVEDAKVALLKYQKCRNNNDSSSDCSAIINAIETDEESQSCDILNTILYGDDASKGTETYITSGDYGQNSIIDQAYTCVKMSMDSDYTDTLSESDSSRLIPVRVRGGVGQIKSFKISWFSDQNAQDAQSTSSYRLSVDRSNNYYRPAGGYGQQTVGTDSYDEEITGGRFTQDVRKPSVLRVDFYQSSASFDLNSFYAGKELATNRFSILFNPTKEGSGPYVNLVPEGSAAHTSTKSMNIPVDIKCEDVDDTDGSAYKCYSIVNIPKNLNGDSKNDDTMFMRVSLPYAAPNTDFNIKLYNGDAASGNEVLFSGVQAVIDSTGRAADQFRRVEARVNLANPDFPYPEYALALEGNLEKSFWITKNCLSANGRGEVTACANYSDITVTSTPTPEGD